MDTTKNNEMFVKIDRGKIGRQKKLFIHKLMRHAKFKKYGERFNLLLQDFK